jgi:predicted nucleotidyltransferase
MLCSAKGIRNLNTVLLDIKMMENKAVVKNIVERLKTFPFVKCIVLFGSSAEGKTTKLSDIDICVIDDPSFPVNIRERVFSIFH